MESLYPTLGILLLIALVMLVLKLLFAKSKEAPARYRVVRNLLTPAERSFYGVLKQAVGNNYEIHAKVRMADILTPKKGLDRSEWQKAFNRISAKHFDFTICDPKTLEIVSVVELNDSSHKKHARKVRDQFIESACESAGLKLHTFPAKKTYSLSELRASIEDISVDA